MLTLELSIDRDGRLHDEDERKNETLDDNLTVSTYTWLKSINS